MVMVKNKIWLITDTHFNHKKIAEYCNRPENYEGLILHNLKMIPKDDILIHLGDVCLGNDEEMHRRLNNSCKCKKVLVRGNHDKKTSSWYYEHGWDFVCHSFTDRYFRKWILFSHKPKEVGKHINWNIHGHFHNANLQTWEPEIRDILCDKHRLLCLEDSKYRPVLLDSFLKRGKMI